MRSLLNTKWSKRCNKQSGQFILLLDFLGDSVGARGSTFNLIQIVFHQKAVVFFKQVLNVIPNLIIEIRYYIAFIGLDFYIRRYNLGISVMFALIGSLDHLA